MLTPVILASASPRRQALLSYILEQFDIVPADIDETSLKDESPRDLVERLAKTKAQVVLQQFPEKLIIGSDTVVARDETALGKPVNEADFMQMMSFLSNAWHHVFTGICVCTMSHTYTGVVVTRVKMSNISEQDAIKYWRTDEPKDKAGGYAIQGIGGQFVEKIDGSFSAVVGLPLCETKQLLLKVSAI
ncbi:MAG: Maf family protein [Glaciecola sp.]